MRCGPGVELFITRAWKGYIDHGTIPDHILFDSILSILVPPLCLGCNRAGKTRLHKKWIAALELAAHFAWIWGRDAELSEDGIRDKLRELNACF